MKLIYTVPQAHCIVIERFGKFNRIQTQGLHFRIPFIEKFRLVSTWHNAANKNGVLIELSEQQTDTLPRQCHTSDNVAITVNASVYWRIIDPVRALYEVDILPQSVADITLNSLRANLGTISLDSVLSERQILNERISAKLMETAKKWGIQITRVEIQEIQTSDDTAKAMRQQMEAERKKRALIAESEGQAIATIRVAEAKRDAAILEAEGRIKALGMIAEAEANYLAKVREHTSSSEAVRLLVAHKYLTGFEVISQNPADKVFLPSSFNGIYSISTDDHPTKDISTLDKKTA
jgi:regulator of protease activity HflC (stomatin/prohibitin superfamily)